MATRPSLHLFQVKIGSTLSSIARTVNLAFSPDPLIQWLRPNAIPWAQETPATCRWQYRRIQRVLLEGLVFQSLPVKEMAEYFPSKSALANDRPTPSEWVASDSGSDSGAVLFLFPPREQWKWTVKKLFMALQLWILDKLNPVLDVDSPVTEKLINAHDASVFLLKSKYNLKNLWYLEVVAVHPSLQSRGLGGKAIRWTLDYVRDDPIFLECTREENIGFYENLGFEVVDEVELVDEAAPGPDGRVKFWVMVCR